MIILFVADMELREISQSTLTEARGSLEFGNPLLPWSLRLLCTGIRAGLSRARDISTVVATIGLNKVFW